MYMGRTTLLIETFSAFLQENEIEEQMTIIQKGFSVGDGPFVHCLDKALSSFNVQRQAYYSGPFVGNHVHRCLKVLTQTCRVVR